MQEFLVVFCNLTTKEIQESCPFLICENQRNLRTVLNLYGLVIGDGAVEFHVGSSEIGAIGVH